MSVILLVYLPIDPIDSGLIINEQAIYLSTRYTEFKKIFTTQEFKDKLDPDRVAFDSI
jgi:hypothetical protein